MSRLPGDEIAIGAKRESWCDPGSRKTVPYLIYSGQWRFSCTSYCITRVGFHPGVGSDRWSAPARPSMGGGRDQACPTPRKRFWDGGSDG
jgi:hypothetical protein